MHYPESRFYIRRVRLGKDSALVPPLEKAGYHVEPCAINPHDTVIVEIPVDVGAGIRTQDELSMWEQLSLAAFLQAYWADNQVSCTVSFDPKTEGSQLPYALDYFQYQLKGISFLPKMETGAYPQMPYEVLNLFDSCCWLLIIIIFFLYHRRSRRRRTKSGSRSCLLSSFTVFETWRRYPRSSAITIVGYVQLSQKNNNNNNNKEFFEIQRPFESVFLFRLLHLILLCCCVCRGTTTKGFYQMTRRKEQHSSFPVV